MAEALGVAAGVIAVVTAAAQVSKGLYELISGIRDAPKELLDLSSDLSLLGNTLDSLALELDAQRADGLPAHLERCIPTVRSVAEACKATCDEFSEWLANVTKHSGQGRTSLRDSPATVR